MNIPENTDVIQHIIVHLFDGDERRNTKRMKHILIVFGRSVEYSYFFQCVKTYFFDTLFRLNGVVNLDELMRKKIKRGTPSLFPSYRKFHKDMKSDERGVISFVDLDRRNGLIIRYLSLYYGYIDVMTKKMVYDHSFERKYTYWNFHQNPLYKDKVLPYRLLKQKCVHNLEYYDKVDDFPDLFDCTFRLKKDASIYKVGSTGELHDRECIKI